MKEKEVIIIYSLSNLPPKERIKRAKSIFSIVKRLGAEKHRNIIICKSDDCVRKITKYFEENKIVYGIRN